MVDPPQALLEGGLQLALLRSDDPLVLHCEVSRVGGDQVDLVEQDVADDLGQREVQAVDGCELFEQPQGFVGLRVEGGDDDVLEDAVELLDLLCALELAEGQHDLSGLLMVRLLHVRLAARQHRRICV